MNDRGARPSAQRRVPRAGSIDWATPLPFLRVGHFLAAVDTYLEERGLKPDRQTLPLRDSAGSLTFAPPPEFNDAVLFEPPGP